jgi:hypothetical protein
MASESSRERAASDLRAAARRAAAAPAELPDLGPTKTALSNALALIGEADKTRLAKASARRALALVGDTSPDPEEARALAQVLNQLENPTADAGLLRDRLWELDQSRIEEIRSDIPYVRFIKAAGAVVEAVETTFPKPWKKPPETVEQARTRSVVQAVLCCVLSSPDPYKDAVFVFDVIAKLLEGLGSIEDVEKQLAVDMNR